MDVSPDRIWTALLWVSAFIVSISFHEFGHAWMATKLGDGMPRAQGRLTLSPMAHIDPMGTLLLPLLGAFMPGGFPLLAWGKPVQTNPANYKRLSPRAGHVLVAMMGPLMNLALALVVSLVFIVLAKAGVLSIKVGIDIIQYLVTLNIVLLFFNLIPLPPLDGGAVLLGALPGQFQHVGVLLRRYGFVILLGLMFTGAMRVVMGPAYHLAGLWGRALLRFVAA